MDTHAPDSHQAVAPDKTNPLVWFAGLMAIIIMLVLWFSKWFAAGAMEGVHLGQVHPEKAEAAAPEPDHQKLIADKGPEVLDKGALVFSKNCAMCHGPNGDGNPTNLNPPPRNFHKDAFKNVNGGGPYGIYFTLTNGFNGRMPPFITLKPEEKYAVAHYVRETFVKKDNAANYVEKDSDEVAKKIPAKGAAGTEQNKTPPNQRQVAAPVQPLMAGTVKSTSGDRAEANDWLQRASAGADAKLAPAVAKLQGLTDTQALVALYQTARDNDKPRFVGLLANGTSGRFIPYFSLLPEDEMVALYDHLRHAAGAGKSSAQGVK